MTSQRDKTEEELNALSARNRANRGRAVPRSETPPQAVQAQARATRRNADAEHLEQKALFEWAESAAGLYPELALMFAVPNGGHRRKATAGRLKAEGVKSGVPDICLPVPKGQFHGLYIEMKAGRNQPTDSQVEWLSKLNTQGHFTAVCWGWLEAKEILEWYVAGAEMKG